jgi:hypothetical protein
VSNVLSMTVMFYKSTLFNQDLTQWCVSNPSLWYYEFAAESQLSPAYYPVWGTCP